MFPRIPIRRPPMIPSASVEKTPSRTPTTTAISVSRRAGLMARGGYTKPYAQTTKGGRDGRERNARGPVGVEDAAGDVGVPDVARRGGRPADARLPGRLDEARLSAPMHRGSARDAQAAR